MGGLVKTSMEIQRPRKPLVRSADERRTFSNVTVCEFKLRKLDTMHSGNATERPRGVYYIPALLYLDCIIGFIPII